MTDNDSCSNVPQGRINRNNIIFHFAHNNLIKNTKFCNSNKILKTINLDGDDEKMKSRNCFSPFAKLM